MEQPETTIKSLSYTINKPSLASYQYLFFIIYWIIKPSSLLVLIEKAAMLITDRSLIFFGLCEVFSLSISG